jgi:hypothetical protein
MRRNGGVCKDCESAGFSAAARSWDLGHASRLVRLCKDTALRCVVVWLPVREREGSSSVLGRGGVDGWGADSIVIHAGGALDYWSSTDYGSISNAVFCGSGVEGGILLNPPNDAIP